MRIFLDANILFSAAKSDGAIRQLLAMIAKRGDTLCADAYVVEEARRNLAAKHAAGIPYLDRFLAGVEMIPMALHADRPTHGLPDKDRPVMAAAILGNCDVLVTGDKTHFAPLYGRRIGGVEVLSPAALAERILAAPK